MLSPHAASELAEACRRTMRREAPFACAVVDRQGAVLAAARHPAIHPLFGELAEAKAFTAATFDLPRPVLQEWQQHKPVLLLQLSSFDRLPIVPLDGGVAIREGDTVLGALGIASGSAAADGRRCREVLAALGYDVDGAPTGDADAGPAGGTTGAASPRAAGLTLDDASGLASTAVRLASRLDRTVSVAVTDDRGDPLAVLRTHAAATTTALAVAKAFTAAVLQRTTISLEEWQAREPVIAMQLSGLGGRPLIADFGGVPLVRDGSALGGLGISGAHGEEDDRICADVLREHGFDAQEDRSWSWDPLA